MRGPAHCHPRWPQAAPRRALGCPLWMGGGQLCLLWTVPNGSLVRMDVTLPASQSSEWHRTGMLGQSRGIGISRRGHGASTPECHVCSRNGACKASGRKRKYHHGSTARTSIKHPSLPLSSLCPLPQPPSCLALGGCVPPQLLPPCRDTAPRW